MEVHHAHATSSAQPPLTFPFIGDFLPRVVLATSDYGSSCNSLPHDLTINVSSELSDDSGVFLASTNVENQPEEDFNNILYSPESFKHTKASHVDNCGCCSLPIQERIILQVDGRSWHEQCLRCETCSTVFNNMPTCYARGAKFFCKPCYGRQFGTKCSSCDRVIQATDWVRRARSFVYHLACFACNQCKRQLSTGEEYALQEGKLLCKQHFVELVEGESGIAHQKSKTKRVRTTFAEEQINVLQTHFQIDSNPDGADLERIANMTGLSKRVTQVWFQNSRARQKKYQGNRKPCGGSGDENDSRRSSVGPMSPGQKSDMSNDMIYPRSGTTSVEDAMSDSPISRLSIQYD